MNFHDKLKRSSVAMFFWNYIMLTIAGIIFLTPVLSMVEFDYQNSEIVKVKPDSKPEIRLAKEMIPRSRR